MAAQHFVHFKQYFKADEAKALVKAAGDGKLEKAVRLSLTASAFASASAYP